MKYFLLALFSLRLLPAPFTVATYNLEFYVDTETLGVPPKSAPSRQLIREAIRKLKADVIALQEVGSKAAFEELRASLKAEGVDFPFHEYVRALDTNLHLAFLSRYPIVARRPHIKESYLHQGRRFYVARGFAEITVQPGSGPSITLITAHLKSQRQIADADQQALREEEAALLRERIDEFFRREAAGRLIVLGDLNDGPASKTVRVILGRGRNRLFDPRPAELNGDSLPNPNPKYEPRRIHWTHYYAKEETYSRLDYILLSPSLRAALIPSETFILAVPDWGAASDHRPVRVQLDLKE